MDGHSLQEIATAYVLGTASSTSTSSRASPQAPAGAAPDLRAAVAAAQGAGAQPGPVVVRRRAALTGLERLPSRAATCTAFFQRLYRYGGFPLFTPAAARRVRRPRARRRRATSPSRRDARTCSSGFGGLALLGLFTVKLLFFAERGAHQLVHGLACSTTGGGCASSGSPSCTASSPTFYVDVTDIFMASAAPVSSPRSPGPRAPGPGRRSPSSSPRSPVGRASARPSLAASGIIQWQALLVALYPFCFIEMDGYHVLVDLLGIPTLKHDALALRPALALGPHPERRRAQSRRRSSSSPTWCSRPSPSWASSG